MSVWICGNSQTRALAKALANAPDAAALMNVFVLGNAKYETREYSVIRDNAVALTVEEYADNLLSQTGSSSFDKVHYWGICQGTHTARVYRSQFWHRADPSEIVIGRRRPVTRGVLDAVIGADQGCIRAFLGRLKETQTRCFVIACPPPRADHPCVRNGTRLETIAYIDRRARQLMTQWLSQADIPFVDYPPEVVSSAGLLKPEFYAPDQRGIKDQHHANADYGLLMVKRIIDFLSCARSHRSVPQRRRPRSSANATAPAEAPNEVSAGLN